MTNPQALLIGAAIIASSILLSDGLRPAHATDEGTYQLMHHSNTSANAGVFRLDIYTGGVSYCYIAANQQPTCTAEIK